MSEVNDLVRLFKAVANKRRVEILRLLLDEGEKNVSEVSQRLKISFVSASRHLLQLERVNLLKNRQENLWVYYSVNDNPPLDAKKLLELIKK